VWVEVDGTVKVSVVATDPDGDLFSVTVDVGGMPATLQPVVGSEYRFVLPRSRPTACGAGLSYSVQARAEDVTALAAVALNGTADWATHAHLGGANEDYTADTAHASMVCGATSPFDTHGFTARGNRALDWEFLGTGTRQNLDVNAVSFNVPASLMLAGTFAGASDLPVGVSRDTGGGNTTDAWQMWIGEVAPW
jgi:hypothetical protein